MYVKGMCVFYIHFQTHVATVINFYKVLILSIDNVRINE